MCVLGEFQHSFLDTKCRLLLLVAAAHVNNLYVHNICAVFQICLSNNPSKPCFVLYFKGVALMLDCGLDISQITHFLPLLTIPGSVTDSVTLF